MNTLFDKQVDALLRDNFERATPARDNPTSHDAAPQVSVMNDGTHLDIDELNALTATTLPEATRAAYLQHLMRCDVCRRQASLLALAHSAQTTAANQVDETEAQDADDASAVNAPRDFWKTFVPPFTLTPSLLTTSALATLVMLALSVVLFVALQRQDSSSNIAMQNDSTPAPELIAQGQDAEMSDEATAATSTQNFNAMNSNMGMNANMSSGARSEMNAANGNANGAVNVAPNTSSNGDAAKPKAAIETDQIAELPINGRNANPMLMMSPSVTASPQSDSTFNEQVAVTAAPAPPPALLPNAPRDSRLAEAEDKRRDVQQDTVRRAKDEFAVAQKQKNEAQPSPPATQDADSIGFIKRETRDESASDANRPAARRARSIRSNETERVIGNRRFTRQAQGWVDNSYRIPMRVTNIKRDSDQLRTLITQDSAVRSVVEQLAGSIIIVVNNQAYRIQ